MPKSLTTQTYSQLLKALKKEIESGQERVEREKVKTYWTIGKFISKHLLENKDRAGYGKKLFPKLSKDLKISLTVLYQVHEFYNKYPILRAREELSWAHYRKLLTVKDESERKAFEKKAVSKKWSSRKLETVVKKNTPAKCVSQAPVAVLSFTRGKVGRYSFTRQEKDGPLLLDFGFCVYNDLSQIKISRLKETDCMELGGLRDKPVLKKVPLEKERLFTYKAQVQKIIDGDTIRVLIDLGTGVFVKQRLRLRGIDCPEIDTPEGQKAKSFVNRALKGCDYIIVKTYKDQSDKYDRYLSDIFYLAGEKDAQETADKGVFLNQQLLDKGLALVM